MKRGEWVVTLADEEVIKEESRTNCDYDKRCIFVVIFDR
jgi:hypothetical protein